MWHLCIGCGCRGHFDAGVALSIRNESSIDLLFFLLVQSFPRTDRAYEHFVHCLPALVIQTVGAQSRRSWYDGLLSIIVSMLSGAYLCRLTRRRLLDMLQSDDEDEARQSVDRSSVCAAGLSFRSGLTN